MQLDSQKKHFYSEYDFASLVTTSIVILLLAAYFWFYPSMKKETTFPVYQSGEILPQTYENDDVYMLKNQTPNFR